MIASKPVDFRKGINGLAALVAGVSQGGGLVTLPGYMQHL